MSKLMFSIVLLFSTPSFTQSTVSSTANFAKDEGVVVIYVGSFQQEIQGQKGELVQFTLYLPSGEPLASERVPFDKEWTYKGKLPVNGRYQLQVTKASGNKRFMFFIHE